MANHSIALTHRPVPPMAFAEWVSFVVRKAFGGSVSVTFDDGHSLPLFSSHGGGGLDDVEVFVGERGRPELRQSYRRFLGEWLARSVFESSCQAFGGALIMDDGIGCHVPDFHERFPSFSEYVGLNGGRDDPCSFGGRLEFMSAVDDELSARGFPRDGLQSFLSMASHPLGVSGFGDRLASVPPDNIGSAEADALLLPFCSLRGEPPPETMMALASRRGLGDAFRASVIGRNTQSAIAVASFLGEMPKLSPKVFSSWDSAVDDANLSPMERDAIVSEAYAVAESVAISLGATEPSARSRRRI